MGGAGGQPHEAGDDGPPQGTGSPAVPGEDGAWRPGPDGAAETGLARVSLRCLCPRCGQGRLFTQLLVLRPRCEACGLDLTQMDVGDAMAVPLLIVVGAIAVGLAFWVEFTFMPPLWVHMVIWPIVVIPLTVALMRPAKAFLVAQQYRTQLREAE